MIKTGNDTFLSWFRCRFRKRKDWLTKFPRSTGRLKMAVLYWSEVNEVHAELKEDQTITELQVF